jgi:hypothetical protein
MPYQNISATLDAETVENVIKHLAEVRAMLPFLVNLTPDERQTIPKMGVKTMPFVDKTLDYAAVNPHLVPPYFNAAELLRDVTLAKQLLQIQNIIAQLYESVSDTSLAVGSEAYTASLTFYNTVKSATKSNVPGTDTIYEDLKKRFPQRGKPPANPT